MKSDPIRSIFWFVLRHFSPSGLCVQIVLTQDSITHVKPTVIRWRSWKLRIKIPGGQEDSIKHLWWSFSAKIVNGLAINYFRKKTPSKILSRVVTTLLAISWTCVFSCEVRGFKARQTIWTIGATIEKHTARGFLREELLPIACDLIEKETPAQAFSCEFTNFLE